MVSNPLKIGMIGIGGFGGHRRMKLRESGLFELVAVADRNESVLAKVAAEEQAIPCTSFEELLAVPGLEGIVISTGGDSHAALAIAAMRAGKHVLVEKPLCPSLAEALEMRRVRDETGVIVALGHNHEPSSPYHRLVQQFIADGKFGKIATYELNSSHSGGLEINPGDWRGLADRNPGGMLFQCGVHALHSLCELFGPVEAVQAMLRYDVHTTETADVANVLVRHTSGLIGTLNCYHVTGYNHDFSIFGTVGNLYMDTHHATALYQERRRGPRETREPVELPEAIPGASYANVASWFYAIREGQPLNPSLEHGIQAVVPVFAAEMAAKERREVSLAELGV